MRLTRALPLFLKSLFLQTAWNVRGMQNIGFFYSIAGCTGQNGSEEEEKERRNRHSAHFNTHPYFAPILMGVTLRMEEEEEGGEEKDKLIRLTKKRMSGPLAAVGDALFWETIRPLAAFIGVWIVISALSREEPSLSIALRGPILFLLVFNAAAITIRWWGLRVGYANGKDVVSILKKMHFQQLISRLRWIGAAAVGIWAGLSGYSHDTSGIINLIILILIYIALAKRRSPTAILYILIIAGCSAAFILPESIP